MIAGLVGSCRAMDSKIGDEGSVDAIRKATGRTLAKWKREDELRSRFEALGIEVMRVRERRLGDREARVTMCMPQVTLLKKKQLGSG